MSLKKKVVVGIRLTGELEKKGRLILPYAGQIMLELFIWYLSQVRAEEVEDLFWQMHGKTYGERRKIVEKVLRERFKNLPSGRESADVRGRFDLDRFSDLL